MKRERLVEMVAQAIAKADVNNGCPPIEERVSDKTQRLVLYDEAEAAVEVMTRYWRTEGLR